MRVVAAGQDVARPVRTPRLLRRGGRPSECVMEVPESGPEELHSRVDIARLVSAGDGGRFDDDVPLQELPVCHAVGPAMVGDDPSAHPPFAGRVARNALREQSEMVVRPDAQRPTEARSCITGAPKYDLVEIVLDVRASDLHFDGPQVVPGAVTCVKRYTNYLWRVEPGRQLRHRDSIPEKPVKQRRWGHGAFAHSAAASSGDRGEQSADDEGPPQRQRPYREEHTIGARPRGCGPRSSVGSDGPAWIRTKDQGIMSPLL